MKRILVAVFALAAMGFPLMLSLLPDDRSMTPDPVTITSYNADFTIDGDGTVSAVERITAAFPPVLHGIFRFWDLKNPANSHVRLDPYDIEVTLDGQPVPVEMSWQSGRRYRVAKIGDPDKYLVPGSHTFVIAYRIKGALSPTGAATSSSSSWSESLEAQSVFSWSVVAPGWTMAMEETSSRVTLPVVAERVRCSTGSPALNDCELSTGATEKIVNITTGPLAPRTPVTVRAHLPIAVPDYETLPWSIEADPLLGRSMFALIAVIVLALVGAAVGHWWERKSDEAPPDFPVMYAPPEGVGPAQVAYITNEKVTDDAFVATLLHQAEQGLTRLNHDGEQWSITGMASAAQWSGADVVSRQLGERLGVISGGTFQVNGSAQAGEILTRAEETLAADTKDWAADAGVVVTRGFEYFGLALVGLSLACVVLTVIFLPASIYALPFVGFAVGGAGLLSTGVGTRRTPSGRQLWSRAGGFCRLLSTPSHQDRMAFSARKDLYTSFIPYAVGFGVADEWAQKYRVSMQQEPPSPAWYLPASGASTPYAWTGNQAFSSFESSLSSSIGAYEATQSSSSSGGGGGFSGGGGGGGGSW